MKFNQNDPEGVLWFKSYLESKHFENIHIPEDKFSPYDIEADKDGKHYIFEIKNRNRYKITNSYDWGDTIIDQSKYIILSTYKDQVYVVNLFNDCMCIHKLEDEHEIQHQPHCRANMNWDRRITSKNLISYKNTQQSKREYK